MVFELSFNCVTVQLKNINWDMLQPDGSLGPFVDFILSHLILLAAGQGHINTLND